MFDFLRKKKQPDEALLPEKVEPLVQPEPVSIQDPTPTKKPGFFNRLKSGLLRTRTNLTQGLATLVLGKKVIDAEVLDDLEAQLLSIDVGVEATTEIIKELTARVARKQLADTQALALALKENLLDILKPCQQPLHIDTAHRPYVILMAGVNGSGKTTTIGKLAKQLQSQDKKVLLAAGDTFRAAAVEQLQVWGQRNDIPVIAQRSGSDSASVIYDALQAAKARNIDVVIADTAGRLHTQQGLMDELKKVKRVLQKIDPAAPQEILLVLDATTGQNALIQAQQFHAAMGITGLVLTKLDGTAKGGIIFAIAKKLGLPIRFIGVGEGIDDLRPFVAEDFVSALFAEEETLNS